MAKDDSLPQVILACRQLELYIPHIPVTDDHTLWTFSLDMTVLWLVRQTQHGFLGGREVFLSAWPRDPRLCLWSCEEDSSLFQDQTKVLASLSCLLFMLS